MSDDGHHALTVIALLGSVFSPYYAWARRRGDVDPLNHCAFNVALYGPRGKRWAMTERGRNSVKRSASQLSISRSTIAFDNDCVRLTIDETCAPIPRRIRGEIRIHPLGIAETTYRIDAGGRHLWRPIAPAARVEVALSNPALRWRGHGYVDHNRGTAPLEHDFSHWTWTRLQLPDDSAILYDTQPRRGDAVSLALRFDAGGNAEPFEPPPMVAQRPTGWRMPRSVRSENAGETTIRTLEDTPFYARSAVTAELFGARATGMHESLSLDRFRSPVVQWMLPFRMPRRG